MKKTALLLLLTLLLFIPIGCSDDDEKDKVKAHPVGIDEVSASKSRLGANTAYLGQDLNFSITITSEITAYNVPLSVYFVKGDKFPDLDKFIEDLKASDEKTEESLPDGKTEIGDQDIKDPKKIKDDPEMKYMVAADPILLNTLHEGTHTYDLTVFVPERTDVETSSDWKLIAVLDQENIVDSIGDTVSDVGTIDQNRKSDGKFEKVFLPIKVSNEKMTIPDIAVEWVVDKNTNLPLYTDVIVFPASDGTAPSGSPIINDTNVYINGNLRVFALNKTIQNVPVSFKLYTSSGEFISQLEVWDSEIKGYADSYVIDELKKNTKNRIVPFSLVIPTGDLRKTITSKGQSFVLKVIAETPDGVTEVDSTSDESAKNNIISYNITIIKDTVAAKAAVDKSGTAKATDTRSPGLQYKKNYDATLGNNNFGVSLTNEGKLDVNATDGAMVTLTQDRNIMVMSNTLNINHTEFVAQFAPQSPTDTHAHFKIQFIGINLYYWEARAEFEWEKKWEIHKEKAFPPTVVMVGPVPINLQAGIQGSLGFKIALSLDSEQPKGADEPGSLYNAKGENQLNEAYQKQKTENKIRTERWAKAKQEEQRRKGMSPEDAKNAKRKANARNKRIDEFTERPGVQYPGSTGPGSGGLVAQVGPYITAGAYAAASLGIPGFFEAGVKGNLNIINIEFMVNGLVKFCLEGYLPDNWEARDALIKGSGKNYYVVAVSDVKKKAWTSASAANLNSGGNLILANDKGEPVYADSWSAFVQGQPILVYEPVVGDANTAGSLLYNLRTKNPTEYQHYLNVMNGSVANTDANKLEFRKLQLGDINALVFYPRVDFSVTLTVAGPNGSVGPFAKMYYPKFCEVRPCLNFKFWWKRWNICFSIWYPCGLGFTEWYYPLASFSSWEKTYTLLSYSVPYKDEWKLRIPLDSYAKNIINDYGFNVVSPAKVEPERRLALFGINLSGEGNLFDMNLPKNISDYAK